MNLATGTPRNCRFVISFDAIISGPLNRFVRVSVALQKYVTEALAVWSLRSSEYQFPRTGMKMPPAAIEFAERQESMLH